jgi:hypothetical protein
MASTGWHGSNPDVAEKYSKILDRQAQRIEASKPRFFVGLDLGQASDYSAMTVLRREMEGDKPHCSVPDLKRWPLHTAYPAIVDEVAGRIARSPEHTRLIIDGTGCGRPVVDLFRAHPILKARGDKIIAVSITGGDHELYTDGYHRIPKRNLVGAAQVLLQAELLKIEKDLPLTQTLVTELTNFKVKISTTAHDSYEAWRDGDHDDLVLSVALATWASISKRINAEFAQGEWFR